MLDTLEGIQCCIKATLKLYTSYTQSVDKVLAGVYSYAQVKSYIRVGIVDKY